MLDNTIPAKRIVPYKDCQQNIYFDPNSKSKNGKLIGRLKTLTLVQQQPSSPLLMPPPMHRVIQLDTLQMYHDISFKLFVVILPDRLTSLPCNEGPYVTSWSDQEFRSEIYDIGCSMARRLSLH